RFSRDWSSDVCSSDLPIARVRPPYASSESFARVTSSRVTTSAAFRIGRNTTPRWYPTKMGRVSPRSVQGPDFARFSASLGGNEAATVPDSKQPAGDVPFSAISGRPRGTCWGIGRRGTQPRGTQPWGAQPWDTRRRGRHRAPGQASGAGAGIGRADASGPRLQMVDDPHHEHRPAEHDGDEGAV